MTFSEYAAHGWKLVPISAGTKSPDSKGWSQRRSCIGSAVVAGELQSAGLAHAFSGTCSIDIDELESATQWLAGRGVKLKALLEAPDAVRITSGREGRAKLIYALPDPLTTVKPCAGLELRCASRTGTTMQDVLPPSVHPDTGEPYRWQYNDDLVADWRTLPPLPNALRRVWEECLTPSHIAETIGGGEEVEELAPLLERLDPDCGYDDWLRAGMALHHGTGGAHSGLELWDRWSSQGQKYHGVRDLEAHWRSFDSAGAGLVTSDWLRSQQSSSIDDFDTLTDEDDPFEVETELDAALRVQFQLVPAREWADRPPPNWLVQDLLPQADLAMVYGESSSGKSFLVLDLACAIASGRPWRDEHATVQGSVAWIAAEAAGSMRDRLRAAAQGHGFSLEDLPLWITGETPDLTDLKHVRALAEATAAVSPSLVVVDTLAAASGGSNENSGEDMSAVLAACRVLHKATGALVLLIHHSGKDRSKGARGWSGLRAAMQTEIEVAYQVGNPVRVARIAKQRDGDDGVLLPFRLAPVHVAAFDGEERVSCYVEAASMEPEQTQEETTVDSIASAVFASIAPGNGGTPLADVVANAMLHFDAPAEGSRDLRMVRADRCIVELVERGALRAEGDVLFIDGKAGEEFDA